jgi:hypothetical protein
MLLVIPAAAQRRDRSDTPAVPAITEGISYSLPRTGIRIIVKASQTTFLPGPYAAYAEQLLGIRDVKMQPLSIWDIEDVHFKTYAEPDPASTYKATGGAAAFLQITSDGILKGINSNVAEATSELFHANSMALKNKADELTFNYLIDNPALTGRTSLDQRAIQAANRILRARSIRYDIAAGLLDEFHPDGEAYKQSLEELNRMEAELIALFTGKTAVENYTFTFDYLPLASVSGDVVFRFDENRGFLPKTDLSGKPVMIDVIKNEQLSSRLSALGGEQAFTPGLTGLYYRQPGIADIRISQELKLIATGRAVISQFGIVLPIPRELLDGNFAVEIHPETGAIKSIGRK